METEDGSHRFVLRCAVYNRSLCFALAKTSYGTHDSGEKVAPRELLRTLELEGTLI